MLERTNTILGVEGGNPKGVTIKEVSRVIWLFSCILFLSFLQEGWGRHYGLRGADHQCSKKKHQIYNFMICLRYICLLSKVVSCYEIGNRKWISHFFTDCVVDVKHQAIQAVRQGEETEGEMQQFHEIFVSRLEFSYKNIFNK